VSPFFTVNFRRIRAETGRRWQVNLRARYDAVCINDSRVDGEKVAPASPLLILLRDFPSDRRLTDYYG